MILKTKGEKYGLIFSCILFCIIAAISCSKEGTSSSDNEELKAAAAPEVNMMASLRLDGDTGRCPYGPGFCPIKPPFGPLPEFSFENGGDAFTKASLDNTNSTLNLKFIEIRSEWYTEGGYIDGKFTTPEFDLDTELAEALGADRVTIKDGVYDMAEDESTGEYSVVIDVVIE